MIGELTDKEQKRLDDERARLAAEDLKMPARTRKYVTAVLELVEIYGMPSYDFHRKAARTSPKDLYYLLEKRGFVWDAQAGEWVPADD